MEISFTVEYTISECIWKVSGGFFLSCETNIIDIWVSAVVVLIL